jgi:hypothetical protein
MKLNHQYKLILERLSRYVVILYNVDNELFTYNASSWNATCDIQQHENERRTFFKQIRLGGSSAYVLFSFH